MNRTMLALIGLLLVAAPRMAVAQAPATMPSTAPADGPVDQTTPQGTLILLSRTMQSGDAVGARKLLHATTPDELILVGLFVQAVEVNLKFRDAVTKAFGDGVADNYVGSASDEVEAEKTIRTSKVDIQNDSASVISRAGEDPVKLVRVEGMWKLSMGAIGAEEMASTQKELKLRLGVLAGIADDVAAGKFKTVQDMENAMRTRMASAILEATNMAPTTAPTAPAAPARGN